jgi:hypothetical protein
VVGAQPDPVDLPAELTRKGETPAGIDDFEDKQDKFEKHF